MCRQRGWGPVGILKVREKGLHQQETHCLGSSPSPVFPSYDKYYKILCLRASVSLSVDGAGHSTRFLEAESGK